MSSRGVLGRELRELELNEVLIVPFKYCAISNIKKTVSVLGKEGLKFSYDNSGMENSIIQRIK